tara:strand:+ start:83 stop:568 length:486 start_codon:yes stop_codon:yes gene_type:complete
MNKLFFLFFITPIFCFSQLNISIDVIERTDTQKEFNKNINFFVGKYLHKNMVIGVTNKQSLADYIEEGYTPVQDSLIISNYQFFSKYYFQDNLFLTIRSPISLSNKSISTHERIRIGAGYVFYKEENNNTEFYISYNFLLKPNSNGFRKGELNVGVSLFCL